MPVAKKKKTEKAPPQTDENEAEGNDENEGNDEAPLTRAEVAEMVNGALSGFVKKRLPKLFETSITSAVAKLQPPPKTDEGEEEEDDDEAEAEADASEGKGGKTPPPASPKKKTAADKRVAKLQAQVQAMEAERKAEKEKALRAEERSAVLQALTSGGVRKEQVGALTTWLLSEDSGRKVRRDAEGNIVFVGDDEDEVTVTEGLKAWLGTDEGKAYVAPRGAQGSNNTGPGAPRRPAPGGITNGASRAASNAALDNQLYELVVGMPDVQQQMGS